MSAVFIESAGYGDLGGRHGLIGCSNTGLRACQEVVNRTDRPGYPPLGVTWSPYISGFRHDDVYVVMKTFPDLSASRSGMVYTFALFAPLREITEIEDIRFVLRLLPETPERHTNYSRIQVEPSSEQGVIPQRVPAALAEALVRHAGRTIVWLGQQGFEDAVASLWSAIWPETREALSFRLSFEPQDLEYDRPTIVCSPEVLESRWSAHPVANSHVSSAEITDAAAALCDVSVGVAIRDFKVKLGARIQTFADLRALAKLFGYVSRPGAPLSAQRSKLHLLHRFAPEPALARELKAAATENAVLLLAREADIREVRAFRNIPFQAFETSPTLIAQLSKWIAGNIVGCTIAGNATHELIADAIHGEQPWRQCVLDGVLLAVGDLSEGRAQAAVWKWVLSGADDACGILQLFVRDERQEELLANTCPTHFPSGMAEKVRQLCVSSGWILLHAGLLSSMYEPARAIPLQMELPSSTERQKHAFGLIMQRSDKTAFVDVAVTLGGESLMEVAGDAIYQEPAALAGFDPASPNWQRIWSYGVLKGHALSRPKADLDQLAQAILQYASQGASVGPEVWEVLALTAADISAFPSRRDLWPLIPGLCRNTFLTETAQGWMRRFENSEALADAVEPELAKGIVRSPKLDAFLSKTSSIPKVLELFTQVGLLEESRFVNWVRRLPQVSRIAFAAGEVEELGRFIAGRRWRSAARELAAIATSRAGLRPAVRICVDLLGVLQRLRLALSDSGSTIVEVDVWSALEELALDLYPWGPGDRNVWERAGGDPSMIAYYGTGREAWSDRIRRSKRGSDRVTPWSLLAVMREDFPNNEELRRLSEYMRMRP